MMRASSAHFHGFFFPISSSASSSASASPSPANAKRRVAPLRALAELSPSPSPSLSLSPSPPPSSSPSSPLASATSSTSSSTLSAKERRKQKNARREQKKAEEGSSWKETIDQTLAEKKKGKGGSGRPGLLQYELDMTSRLTSRGVQWWMVLVSARFELEVSEAIAQSLKLEFPEKEFQVYVPVVPSKRKMKDGSFSTSTKVLHSGCVFLQTVMCRRVHDIVKKVPRCRGFFGKKVGYLEQVIMPTPVPPEDMDGMFKKVKEEEEDFERLKHIAQQEREIMRAAKEAEEANQSLAATQVNETPVAVATIGSKVRIVNGPYVNFDGLISDLTDDGKKVQVSISAFGNLQKVSLTLEDVELTS